MTAETDLVRAILGNLSEADSLWLIFADWREENGAPERAELIRAQPHQGALSSRQGAGRRWRARRRGRRVAVG